MIFIGRQIIPKWLGVAQDTPVPVNKAQAALLDIGFESEEEDGGRGALVAYCGAANDTVNVKATIGTAEYYQQARSSAFEFAKSDQVNFRHRCRHKQGFGPLVEAKVVPFRGALDGTQQRPHCGRWRAPLQDCRASL